MPFSKNLGVVFALISFLFASSTSNLFAKPLTKERAQSLISPIFSGIKIDENPSDENVMALGQMGGNLHPNAGASDAGQQSDLRLSKSSAGDVDQDNYAFSMAMNEWNVHDYKKAYKSFDKYLKNFPDGKWVGEAILHQGCEARFNGRYREAGDKFNDILARYDGSLHVGEQFIADKAKSRLAVLRVMQNSLDDAYALFTELKESAEDWRQRTYAASWLVRISKMRASQNQLADCGNKALSDVLAKRGQLEDAERVAKLSVENEQGYSLTGLRELAEQFGLNAVALNLPIDQLANMNLPAIAQIDRSDVNGLGHYWVVESVEGNKVTIYDAQKFRRFEQTLEQFGEEWGGNILVFSEAQEVLAKHTLTDAQAEQIFGGCCGVQRPEHYLGWYQGPGQNGESCSYGCPTWSVNPLNMNVYVRDTPIWYSTPFGPDVELTLSYNSQSSIAGNEVFGNKWLMSYNSYLVVDPGTAVTVFMPDGRRDVYLEDGNGGFETQSGTYNTLSQLGPYHYVLRLEEGMEYTYQLPSNTGSQQPFLTKLTDIHGQSLTFTYDSQARLSNIIDAQKRASVITYGPSGHVASVTDPFGRQASFAHDSMGNLIAITDMGGYESTLTYDADAYIQSVTKPGFGTWSFLIEPADGIGSDTNPYPAPGNVMWENYRITVTDPLSRKTEYHYDGNNSLSWVVKPEHYVDYVSETRNNFHQPKTIYELDFATEWERIQDSTDELGNTRQYTYTSEGRFAAIYDENETRTHFYFNRDKRPYRIVEAEYENEHRETFISYLDSETLLLNEIEEQSIHDGEDKITTLTYDANRYLDTVTVSGFDEAGNAVQRVVDFDFNALGQLVRYNGGREDVTDTTQFGYYGCADPAQLNCHQLHTITNALGQVTTFESYAAGGQPARIRDANGLISEYTYDGLQRVVRVQQFHESNSANVQETILTYHGAKDHVASISFSEGMGYTLTYDNAEQLTQIIDSLGNRITYAYDGNGNQTVLERYDASNTLEQRVESAYDLIDNLSQITAGTSNWQTQISVKGLLASSTDANQNTPSQNQYDLLDRLIQHVDALGNTTQFVYNVADQTKEVIAPNGAKTTFSYDDLGNVLSETSPDRGLLNYGYDTAGNVIYRQDARGVEFDFTYDALNRLTYMSSRTNENSDIIYTYDTCLNGIGRLCRIAERSNESNFEYDAWGNITSVVRTYLAFGKEQTYTTLYEYDKENRVTKTTYPSGRVIETTYDAMGRATSVSNNGANVVQFRQLRADNQIAQQTFGNGAQEQRVYDDQSRLTSVEINNTELLALSYDANGNVITLDNGAPQTFGYDPLDRLVSDAGLASDLVYAYDENGNRTSLTEDSNILPYTYLTDSNQLTHVGASTLTRDASGNLVNDGLRQYNYNDHGQLESTVKQGQAFYYAYDARWQRLRKRHGAWLSDYHYDLQGRLIAISDAEGQMVFEYIYADQNAVNPIARIEHQASSGQPNSSSQTAFARTVEGGFNQLPAASNDVNFVCQSNEIGGIVPPDPDDDYQPTPLTEAQIAERRAKFVKIAPMLYWLLMLEDDFTELPNVVNLEIDLTPALNDSQASFYWGEVEGATQYAISSSTDPNTLSQSTNENTLCATETRANVYDIDQNQPLYIRVWAYVNDDWQYQDYTVNEPTPAQANSRQTLYLVQDQLGTPRVALNENGDAVWHWQSDGFGNVYPNQDVDGDGLNARINLRFAGQYYDQETGLYYNWHRYYDAKNGRYVSSDTLGLFDGQNTFTYVYGNPISSIDPTGEVGLAGAGIGAGIDLAGQLATNGGRWRCVDWKSVAFSGALGAVGGIGASVGRAATTGAFKHSISGAKWSTSSSKWGAVRSRYRKYHNQTGTAPKGDWQAHHWAFSRGGREGPTWRNHPLNLNPLPTAVHRRIHTSWQGQRRFNIAQRWWYGTPRWYKEGQTVGGAAGGAAGYHRGQKSNGGCGCNR